MRWDDVRIVDLLRRLNEEMTAEMLAIQAFDEPGRQADGFAVDPTPDPPRPRLCRNSQLRRSAATSARSRPAACRTLSSSRA